MTARLLARIAVAAGALLAAGGAPASAAAPAGVWLAGDGHVHTCYSHDSWCPPDDDNTGPDTFYSSFASVEQRFLEATVKGLDFLVISDHDDIRAWSDPAFGSQGVIGVKAYEASVPGGHAHVIGATRHYDEGPGGSPEQAAASLNAMAEEIEADGGILQANHPGYRGETPVDGCEDLELSQWHTTPMHWRYGFDVRPGMIEVWNPTTLMQPGELFWECWLQRGYRIPAGGGSDSHGGNQFTIGSPTLWVYAKRRTEQAIVAAMKEGRTTISRRSPSEGALRLVLEDQRRVAMGHEVEPRTKLRVRVEGLWAPGWVRVRANGSTLIDRAPILPGGVIEFDAPQEPGWVRASLLMTDQSFTGTDPNCTANEWSARSPISLCSDDLLVAAMTSPVYVAGAEPPAPARAVRRRGARGHRHAKARHRRHGARRAHGEHEHADEPDDKPRIAAVRHSGAGRALPDVPVSRRAGETLRRPRR